MIADYRILSEYTGKTLLRALEEFNDGSASTSAPTSADEARLLTDSTAGSIATELEDALTKLDGKASPSSALNLTLSSGSWSSATPPTQTVSATGVTANNNVIVGIGSGATSAQLDAAGFGKIICTAQGAGTLTFTCYGTEPQVNIPVSVLIVG